MLRQWGSSTIGYESVCSELTECEVGIAKWRKWRKITAGETEHGSVDMVADPLADARQRFRASMAALDYGLHRGDEALVRSACRSLYSLYIPDLEEEPSEVGVERSPEERDSAMTIIIEGLYRGMSVAAACASVPINRETVYTWARIHPEFALAFEAARQHARETGARSDRRGDRSRSVGMSFYGEVSEPAVPVGR